MFDWLKREIREVKTPRFHVVDGPADVELEQAITQSGLPVPPSYSQFVLEFGNAKLYRRSREGYTIRIFAGPRKAVWKDGTEVYYLGSNDGASVYVKAKSQTIEGSIYEFEDIEEIAADGFADWLRNSCDRARRSYKGKWNEILRGPKPFTAAEAELIAARQKISWQAKGIDDEGNHIFEVKNNGSRTLPFLTIGLHSRDRKLNGAVRLDTGGIAPGQTGILHVDCYKKFKPPQEMEAFALPDPQPEDREYYYEFEGQRQHSENGPVL